MKLIIFFLINIIICQIKNKYQFPQHDILYITNDNINDINDSNDFWLIKFYAPQCVHCKKIWNLIINLKILVQADSKHKVYFGEVSCEDPNATAICEKYNVKQIPQLKIFKKGELLSTYTNYMNDEDVLKKWVHYVTTPTFVEVKSEDEFNLYETDDNIFLICSDKINEDVVKIAKKYSNENYFLNIKDKELCKNNNFKENHLVIKGSYDHSYYNLDNFTTDSLNAFINKNKYMLINKIDHYNFFNLRSSGMNLILLVLDLNKKYEGYITTFTEYANKYKTNNDFIFGYIDGITYEEALEFYGVNPSKYPQIIIFSKTPKEYYFESYFDLNHLNEIINGVINNTIDPKKEDFSRKYLFFITVKKRLQELKNFAFRDFRSFFGFICSILLIIFTVVLITYSIFGFIYKSNNNYEESDKED